MKPPAAAGGPLTLLDLATGNFPVTVYPALAPALLVQVLFALLATIEDLRSSIRRQR